MIEFIFGTMYEKHEQNLINKMKNINKILYFTRKTDEFSDYKIINSTFGMYMLCIHIDL